MNSYIELKLKLSSLGVITPDAWVDIANAIEVKILKKTESFTRETGSITYVFAGLLKEYEVRHRKKPTIINFIRANETIVTRKYNQAQYLKASCETTLLHIASAQLIGLYLQHKELLSIYQELAAGYDEDLAYRQLVIEEKNASQRIQLFLLKYRKSLLCISKKEMANYLLLNYDYFTLLYHQLL